MSSQVALSKVEVTQTCVPGKVIEILKSGKYSDLKIVLKSCEKDPPLKIIPVHRVVIESCCKPLYAVLKNKEKELGRTLDSINVTGVTSNRIPIYRGLISAMYCGNHIFENVDPHIVNAIINQLFTCFSDERRMVNSMTVHQMSEVFPDERKSSDSTPKTGTQGNTSEPMQPGPALSFRSRPELKNQGNDDQTYPMIQLDKSLEKALNPIRADIQKLFTKKQAEVKCPPTISEKDVKELKDSCSGNTQEVERLLNQLLITEQKKSKQVETSAKPVNPPNPPKKLEDSHKKPSSKHERQDQKQPPKEQPPNPSSSGNKAFADAQTRAIVDNEQTRALVQKEVETYLKNHEGDRLNVLQLNLQQESKEKMKLLQEKNELQEKIKQLEQRCNDLNLVPNNIGEQKNYPNPVSVKSSKPAIRNQIKPDHVSSCPFKNKTVTDEKDAIICNLVCSSPPVMDKVNRFVSSEEKNM